MILDGVFKGIGMLLSADPELWKIIFLTLRVSGTATALSVAVGVPLGVCMALASFPGRRVLISLINTGLGLPPVVAGLWVSLLFWRYGPLGFLGLMYSPAAMIIAQTVLALPVVAGLTLAGVGGLNPRLRLQIEALGASKPQMYWLLVSEARYSVMAAVMAGFGAAVSEVGASMMVGGNILGQTRVLTTATVMEVSKGNFDAALALGLVLLVLAYGATAALTWIQQGGRNR